jgi:hypothetical protein
MKRSTKRAVLRRRIAALEGDEGDPDIATAAGRVELFASLAVSWPSGCVRYALREHAQARRIGMSAKVLRRSGSRGCASSLRSSRSRAASIRRSSANVCPSTGTPRRARSPAAGKNGSGETGNRFQRPRIARSYRRSRGGWRIALVRSRGYRPCLRTFVRALPRTRGSAPASPASAAASILPR